MTAVVLAAGMGTRLRPLTDTLPKCLLPVGGMTLLERTFRALDGAAVDRAVLVVGYREEQIRKAVDAFNPALPVDFVVNSQFAQTNNNVSLWLAGPEAAGDDILVLDGDILFHRGILTRILAAPHDNVLALREGISVGAEEIKVVADSVGKVVKIGKEVPAGEAGGESLGIERFSAIAAAGLFDALERRRGFNEFYEASFQEMINAGLALHTVRCGDLPCIEIDTEEDLREADRIASAGL
jgi:choline kinase